jgi:hypothetical protein
MIVDFADLQSIADFLDAKPYWAPIFDDDAVVIGVKSFFGAIYG